MDSFDCILFHFFGSLLYIQFVTLVKFRYHELTLDISLIAFKYGNVDLYVYI